MKKKVNYHGYITIPRHFKHFLHELEPALLHLYNTLVLDAVWDQKKEEFGHVLRTNDEIAELCNCNQSTVSRNLKKLQEKNLIIKEKNRVIVLDYVLFLLAINKRLANKDFASMQELCAFVRNNYACKHKSIAKYLYLSIYPTSQSFNVSSKGKDTSSYPYEVCDEDVDPDEIIRGMAEKNASSAHTDEFKYY